jgi:hypothetical protein
MADSQPEPQTNNDTTPTKAEQQSSTQAATSQPLTVAAEPTSPTTGADGEPKILRHIEKVFRSSETRTPLVAAFSDGDPYYTVSTLARRDDSAVWSIVMGTEKNEQNALDYVQVGTQNGDWVYLTNVEKASQEVLRKIAVILYTLKPEPQEFPRRHLFRLWLITDTPIQVNDTIRPIFPQSLLQHALVARSHIVAGTSAGVPSSPDKYSRRMPAEVPLHEEALVKHSKRREIGRDSDSESDAEEPEKKATGMWFHRAVDFFAHDGGSTVARVNEVIFDAVDKQNTKEIAALCNSGRPNIDAVTRDGMNPLMFAVSRERVESVKALLAAGADVHVRRAADNCPLLFMCVESEAVLTALIEAGANIDERFEGYRLENHPTTMPHIAAMVRELKGVPPVKTSALQLAATIGASAP